MGITVAGKPKPANSSQGWDEGVMEMSLGEKSILTITGYVRIHMLSDSQLYGQSFYRPSGPPS